MNFLREKTLQQEELNLVPLSGVDYMDETMPWCPIMNHVYVQAIKL